MRQVPRNTRVEEEGLTSYFDRTQEKHGGKLYADFVQLIGPDSDLSKPQVARRLNMTVQWLYKLIAIHDRQGGAGRQKEAAK